MQVWLMLGAAIVCEVGGTTCLKLSEGFSRALPASGVVVLYLTSFTLLARVVQSIDIGVAYAIWAGVGTALVAGVGITFFGEAISWLRFVSLAFVVAGVVGLQLSGAIR
ncbi:MAG: multidrug efflux SMR transporter [Myxococcales bacterium]|nr:multidrug efflux SMR transporter [Myxococcales bacterium]MDH5567360.1 multidrug efflux SMR transporter [Myxococcales bacterium]